MIVYKIAGSAVLQDHAKDVQMAREIGIELVTEGAGVHYHVEAYGSDPNVLVHWWTEGEHTDAARLEAETDMELERINLPDVKVRRQRLDLLPWKRDLELRGFDPTGRICVSPHTVDLYEVRPAANPAETLWIAPDTYLDGWHEDSLSRFWWRLHWNRAGADA